jgi:hypothetical protein
MSKRRKRKRSKSHGPGASKSARKLAIGKMSFGCLVLLLIVAAGLIIPRLLSGEG